MIVVQVHTVVMAVDSAGWCELGLHLVHGHVQHHLFNGCLFSAAAVATVIVTHLSRACVSGVDSE